MFHFRDKTIFIISPERWGTMKVSKHHYALELAALYCRIFFIEPPDLANKNITISACEDHPMISLVRYKPIFRGKRFLPAFIYSFLVKRQIHLLCNKIGVKPDLVWCFQGYLFHNLDLFGAPVNIFFAADLFYYKYLPLEINSADFSLAVSDSIYKIISASGEKVYLINHGLQALFVKGAATLLQSNIPNNKNQQLIAGYTGNLRMEALDRETMKDVIRTNPDIRFLFWGSYQKKDLNLGGVNDAVTDAFIQFLETQPNVELKGVVNTNELQIQMKEADLFWLCWKIDVNQLWDGSNSHKILEYLSTGKPVVAHHVSMYQNTNLLTMLSNKKNEGYLELFQQTIQTIILGEPQHKINKRLEAAIANSYKNQLQYIENLINQNLQIGK
jgi:glycosyltransferase involved in cell wall biosynthesis